MPLEGVAGIYPHLLQWVPLIMSRNRPFPSSPQPPFQSDAKCEVFVTKISFHSY